MTGSSIVARESSRRGPSRGRAVRRASRGDDRLGDEARGTRRRAPRRSAPRGRDPPPRPRDQALVGVGQRRVAQPRAGRRRRQPELGRRRPLLAEQRLDARRSRRAIPGMRREAVARVADRVAQHVARARSCRSRAAAASRRRTRPARRRRAGRCRARGRARARGRPRSSRRAAPAPARRRRAARPSRQISIGTSPPGPLRCGSTTCSAKPAATAASNALPPRSSTAIPAADASQCVEATMPKVPLSSGRVVNIAAILGMRPKSSKLDRECSPFRES